ncbi:NAD(P)-dependent oxidoreductase [Stutzerimonas stutzeri]|uniref:NAD(P)-dependent oxidoreductase n=1 Tax=Stutzerimonas stutzeri TaxID=316 RepID=UPI00210E76E2|nr:NAD(P)-dependent oxidoreductase [Stutzerimonas stutzeri]MCQ4320085.1 hypothetical protein [Stutzerimonas stutzeri]
MRVLYEPLAEYQEIVKGRDIPGISPDRKKNHQQQRPAPGYRYRQLRRLTTSFIDVFFGHHVFREEPLPASHPFWRMPQVTITPHVSARILREGTVEQIATKIQALEAGREITGAVDIQRGY